MSLRSYLQQTEVEVVHKELSPDLEIADYLRKCKKPVLFKRIKGHEEFSVAGNLLSSRNTLASLLGVDVKGLVKHLACMLSSPSKYRLVDDAAW
ncbi:MAG: UbiD family decarboxylase, partial [Nitrososphaerales archaeon]